MINWPSVGPTQWTVVLTVGLFVVALFGIMLSWLYGLYEVGAMLRFHPPTFRRGRRVVDFSEAFPSVTTRVGRVVSTDHGQFKFVEPDLCLFRWQRGSWFETRTPVPLKGRFRLADSVARVEGRTPVAASVMLGAWVAACAALGLGGLIGKAFYLSVPDSPFGFPDAIPALLLAFGPVMYWVSIRLERRRLLRVYGEIKRALTGGES